MLVKDFCDAYKAKRFMVTKNGVDERQEWIKKELDIKSYIPFTEKKKVAEMIVQNNITEIDGIKKYDSISGFMSMMVSSIVTHTNLEFGDNPVSEYDMLAESGLLPQIIAQFQGSHDEIDLLRKMVLDMELEDNQTGALIERFLNKISVALDGVLEVAKDKFKDFDMKDILGADFKGEDFAQLKSFLDKLN